MSETLVTPLWCQLMAQYNRWQNRVAVEAAGGIAAAERTRGQGAFWGSIQGTLVHLLWADHMWMSRLDGWEPPKVKLADSAHFVADWAELRSKRQITDARISRWAQGLTPEALEGDLSWYSGAAGRDMTMPRALCVAQMFNHQTHHRGQVHAMLTACGAKTAPSDLLMLPELVG